LSNYIVIINVYFYLHTLISKQETAYNYNYYVHFNVVTFFDVIKGQVRTVGKLSFVTIKY
jgi:hypothetical protein